MTDFTLSSGSFVEPHRSPYGGFPIRHFGVSTGVSSAIIFRGSLVTLDKGSTNQQFVKRSTATDAPEIVGYSCETTPSTTVAGTEIGVYEADPRVEFRAVTQNGVIGSTTVGELKALVFDSTHNIHYVDLAEGTASKLRVIVTELIDSPGDSGGKVAYRHVRQALRNSSIASTVNILAFYY